MNTHLTRPVHAGRRRLTVPLVALALGAALALPACAASGSGALGPAPTVSAPRSQSPSPSTPPPTTKTPAPTPGTSASEGPTRTSPPRPPGQPPGTTSASPRPKDPGSPGKVHTFQLWFVRDGALAVTSRTRPWTPAVAHLAVTELVAGPSAVEAAAGMRSPIRTDTTFSIASYSRGVASIDLPSSFFAGGRTLARQRQAQVVYTLTQYPTFSKVEFRINGAGNMPVGRADYADLLPPIVVTSPHIGAAVTSPVTVSGTANVFEATVSIRILDASGAEIATAFTTATCGTGCRGSYSTAVRFAVGRTQPGTIQVYEVSAENGSRIHVVDIPVTLSP
ncbi:Gmad2 immunoglobulin-like domain-containing protein [Actinopolymorpha sp. B17G11]|uniref:Gmad2 immunoglobulin-like domain-containing protein n=1 Tax=Actinopolymorpha sp. B17G11 TaxID=3160861 RepID=UPI0032E4167A